MGTPIKRLTPLQAWDAIRHYCAYQERAHSDVRNRLRAHGLTEQEAEEIISRLIEENFLNEERFAEQYAGGHFRLKQWGRVKIRFGLKQLGVSEYCIRQAMRQIDEEAYGALLSRLADAKWRSVRGLPVQRWAKTRQYLLQKGFEPDLVLAELRRLESGKQVTDN